MQTILVKVIIANFFNLHNRILKKFDIISKKREK
jgi:hypothetical protein